MPEKPKVYFVRVPEEAYQRIAKIAEREMRSINAQTNVLLTQALDNYSYAIPMPPSSTTLVVDPELKDIQNEPAVETPTVKKISRLDKPKEERVVSVKATSYGKTAAARAEVGVVNSCEHGFAKGFCKKADCNRKYAK